MDGALRALEIPIIYADNDIQLAGALVDHPDINLSVCKRGKYPRCSSYVFNHSPADGRYECKLADNLDAVRLTGAVNIVDNVL